jgi:membrane protease YdiL (CAAX protease family)
MNEKPWREIVIAFASITGATSVLSASARLPLLAPYTHLAVGTLFFWAAVQLSQRQPDGLARYGLELGGLLDAPEPAPSGFAAAALDLGRALLRALPSAARELGVACLVGLVVFPPFAFGFFLFHAPTRPFALALPEALPSFALTQLIVVAIPEEALFRGYFQGRLDACFSGRVRLLGVSLVLPSLVLQALLFALIHLASDTNPARLAVFFPALLFGWLRAWRGGIGAAAGFHALCNLLSDVLARSWF